jgi:hypothetical protein
MKMKTELKEEKIKVNKKRVRLKMQWNNLTERKYKEQKKEVSKMQSRNVNKKMNVLADHFLLFRTTKASAKTTARPLLTLNDFNEDRIVSFAHYC